MMCVRVKGLATQLPEPFLHERLCLPTDCPHGTRACAHRNVRTQTYTQVHTHTHTHTHKHTRMHNPHIRACAHIYILEYAAGSDHDLISRASGLYQSGRGSRQQQEGCLNQSTTTTTTTIMTNTTTTTNTTTMQYSSTTLIARLLSTN